MNGSRIDSVAALFVVSPWSWSVHNDDYGRDELAPRKPRPFLLDMLLDEQPRSSAHSSRFLQLPDHILADIVDYLMGDTNNHDDASRRSLAALALTNSACRHLAHAARFCCITLDYSERARELAQALVEEAPRAGAHRRLRLRPYIRHATFNPHRRHVVARHRTLYDTSSLQLADRLGHPDHGPLVDADAATATEAAFHRQQFYQQARVRQRRLEREAAVLYIATRDTAVAALASLQPGLHTLVWNDAVGVGLDVFHTLASIPAHHVRIQHVSMIDDAPWATLSRTTVLPWPIRSLSLNVRVVPLVRSRDRGPPGLLSPSKMPHTASPAYAALFHRCAPTLETLYWTSANPIPPHVPLVAIGDPSPPAFPRLHSLYLDNIAVDETTLTTLVSAPRLRHLALPARALDKYAHLLPEIQPRLHTFVTRVLPVRDDATGPHLVRFVGKLAATDALTKLALREVEPGGRWHVFDDTDSASETLSETASLPPSLLDRHVVPLLRETCIYDDGTRALLFRSLRSLSLEWNEPVPDSALAVLGQLTALTQLSLGGGGHSGRFVPTAALWVVDHARIQHHLRALSRLTKLALVHDTYPAVERPPSPDSDPDDLRSPDYYEDRVITADVRAAADARILLGDVIDMAVDNMQARHGDGNDSDADDHRHPDRFRALRWHPVLLQDDSLLDTTWRDRIYELSTARDRRLNSVWERAHRNRMLSHAEGYAEVLPSLEWLCIGQRPMAITRDDGGIHAIPLTDTRDPCTAFLESTFGLPEGCGQ